MPFIVVVAYCVIVALVYSFRLIPEDQVEACNDAVIAITTGFASWQVFSIMKQFAPGEPSRTCWMLFACGLFCDFIGHTIYSVAQLVVGTVLTFPHAADIFIMIGQLLYVISFILFLLQMTKLVLFEDKGMTSLANGIFIVLLSLNLYFIIVPTILLEEETAFMRALYLVYPVFDTLLAFTCLHLALHFWAMGRSPLTRPWFVMAIAFLIFMVTDSAYAYVNLNGWYHPYLLINPGWGLAYLLVSYATYLQRCLMTSVELIDVEALFAEDDGDSGPSVFADFNSDKQ